MPTTTAGSDLRRLLERAERVFPACPQVGRYFPAASIEDARRRLGRAIDRGDGPCLVVGGPGTGKSLLLQVLAAQYHERFDVVLLACSPLRTRRALLQAILFELGLPYRVQGEGELRLSLLDHLLSAKECPSGLLLLVDEAQSLPVALLDELRVMTNLVRGGAPRVRLVLAGSAALEESFANLELESFSQRLSSRCYLSPMTRNETSQFIRAQVAASGGDPDGLFVGEAYAAVFDATDGVPRLVNQVCDRALVMAEAQNADHVDRGLIQAAWSDLQQLPTPWETDSSSHTAAPASRVIEFGHLSDKNLVDDERGEDMSDVDPTELDSNDLAAEQPMSPVVIRSVEVAGERPGDPFAERFDEEEVVLDNFAAWDNMFLRDRVRVENRRDPGFASLVQDALDASQFGAAEGGPPVVQAPVPPRPIIALQDVEAFDTDAGREAAVEPEAVSDESVSPLYEEQKIRPLRLAVVSDPVPLSPIPFIAPSPIAARGTAAFDPVLPEDGSWGPASWPASFEVQRVEKPGFSPISAGQLSDDAPILVIEDDLPEPPARRPQVRRQEYRHLFSRLRSG
jgi:type II secretory pathway predicted ATPase ExeA